MIKIGASTKIEEISTSNKKDDNGNIKQKEKQRTTQTESSTIRPKEEKHYFF